MQCHAIVVLDTTSTTTTHASNPADTLEEREMKYLTQKNMKKAWKEKENEKIRHLNTRYIIRTKKHNQRSK